MEGQRSNLDLDLNVYDSHANESHTHWGCQWVITDPSLDIFKQMTYLLVPF